MGALPGTFPSFPLRFSLLSLVREHLPSGIKRLREDTNLRD